MMKRWFLILAMIFGLIEIGNAGLITHSDYGSGNTITAASQNGNENAMVNEINGNLDNNNIKPASGTYGDFISLSLPAGDWLINVNAEAGAAGGTWQSVEIGVSNVCGNSGSGLVLGVNRAVFAFASSATPQDVSLAINGYPLNISATTTVCFKYSAVYTVGTPTLSARVQTWRIR